ncbi:type II toxin-antitoxin system VapC family toxin [bacterium]|nr:type II toxin-antitoxin system VapC family toxin [bacterium]
MPSVYVESSVPSYLAARPSRDLLVAAHQLVTAMWWRAARERCDLYVSEAVLQEIRQGDAEVAARRLQFVEDLPVLRVNDEVRRLAHLYQQRSGLSEAAGADMAHVATAAFYEADYLVTWNCSHIANSLVVRRLTEFNLEIGHYMPLIVTPEDLLGSGLENEHD